jgi:DNA-binding NarL/FixJ family response regulator
MAEARIRVIVQHRSTLTREAIAAALQLLVDIEVVATVASLDDVSRTSRRVLPDVIVIDLGLDRRASFGKIARLSAKTDARRFVCIVDRIDTGEIAEAERVGVDHLVSTTVGLDALVDAIRSDQALPARHFVHVNSADNGRRRQALTRREYAVLERVAAGDSRTLIAQALQISPKTVDNHKRSLVVKLGATNQAHAVSIALKRGLLPRGMDPTTSPSREMT